MHLTFSVLCILVHCYFPQEKNLEVGFTLEKVDKTQDLVLKRGKYYDALAILFFCPFSYEYAYKDETNI